MTFTHSPSTFRPTRAMRRMQARTAAIVAGLCPNCRESHNDKLTCRQVARIRLAEKAAKTAQEKGSRHA